MPSVQGSASDASANGVNTPDLDVKLDADTTGGWSPEYERQIALEAGIHGADVGTLPRSLILDPHLTGADKEVLMAMSLWSNDGRLTITQYALAKNLGVTRQAVSKAMRKAVAAGLLQRLEIDGAVHWRMRWATPFKRQPVVDAQRQPVVDSQPVVDVARPRTHAELTPVLNSSSKTKTSSSRTKAAPTPLSDDERAKLHTVFDVRFGSATAVDEAIEEALDHEALKKRKTEYLYLRGWLRREAWKYAETKQRFASAKKNAEAAEARARSAKGEPTHNPLVSEPAPFLTHSALDLPPFRNRQND